MFAAIDITEAACNGFQQSFCICHIIVAVECTLCSHITQCKKRTYDDLDYDMLGKTLDISAVSFHKMIQAAKDKEQFPR